MNIISNFFIVMWKERERKGKTKRRERRPISPPCGNISGACGRTAFRLRILHAFVTKVKLFSPRLLGWSVGWSVGRSVGRSGATTHGETGVARVGHYREQAVYRAYKRVREREGKVGARRVVEHEETGGWQRKGERENS